MQVHLLLFTVHIYAIINDLEFRGSIYKANTKVSNTLTTLAIPYTALTIQADPNHTYLCLGSVDGNKSLNSSIAVQIMSKIQASFGSLANRGTLNSGGGVSCWCIINKSTNVTEQENEIQLKITSYNDNTDLAYNCYLVAIALD